jgi:hypothetical protein
MHYYNTYADIDAALLNQTMSAVMTPIDSVLVGKTSAKERAFDKYFTIMVASLIDTGLSEPVAIQTARRIDRSAKFALADYGLPVSARQHRLRQRHHLRLVRGDAQQQGGAQT